MRRLVLLAALVLVSPAGGGSYAPPPGAINPQWSPDGKRISFEHFDYGKDEAVAFVTATGGKETRIVEDPQLRVSSLSPDWSHVAWVRGDEPDSYVVVARFDGSGRTTVAKSGAHIAPSWSPDSSRFTFQTPEGHIVSAKADGSDVKLIVPSGGLPAWSPSGDLIAYENLGFVHVIRPDGTGDAKIVPGSDPSWSRDGRRLAVWKLGGNVPVLRIATLTGKVREYDLPDASRHADWAPDGRSIVYSTSTKGAEPALWTLSLATGKVRKLSPFGGFGSWQYSPDGTRIVFAGFGECRDRVGIYVMEADGSHRHRVANDCHIYGTAGNDTLRGSDLADVLVGLGGNDRLFANDPGYVGDTLLGGPGNDVLVGGFRQDTLDGGAGDDTLLGGPSGDLLIGGRGHDHLHGQGGADVIRAVDGQRDAITCGPNSYGPAGRDTVYADRIDRVAADCEIVHRR